ncbi:ABC transporter permease [Nitrospirillum pindoramense]|uniref:NitT/TauT family transport system permease protein n=1 Tax=Nitrospirillum amazonense TaxID=28077 RepID=A0A560GUG3_9PROT|nr:ABC transporter permease subunit [Nitrospirillum amazonense]TWB37249.1 NitT/TauT family transport system permease protein [Nitrospirillum amazonense]
MVGRGRAWLVRALSILVLLLLWEGAGRLAASPLAPPASTVLATLAREVVSGALPHHVGITLARVAASFLLAMVAGTALGLAMGWWRTVDLWLDSALLLLLNLPALVLIVLLYVWFGLTEAAAIAAVALNKLPTTAVTVREGVRALDRDLLEMGRAFRFGRAATLRHVVLPQLQPYLFAATRSGLALIWKIVLVVELLGRSDGVGFQIQVYFQLFDVAHILAYSLAFILIIQIIEWAVFQPLERWATRWKAS